MPSSPNIAVKLLGLVDLKKKRVYMVLVKLKNEERNKASDF